MSVASYLGVSFVAGFVVDVLLVNSDFRKTPADIHVSSFDLLTSRYPFAGEAPVTTSITALSLLAKLARVVTVVRGGWRLVLAWIRVMILSMLDGFLVTLVTFRFGLVSSFLVSWWEVQAAADLLVLVTENHLGAAAGDDITQHVARLLRGVQSVDTGFDGNAARSLQIWPALIPCGDSWRIPRRYAGIGNGSLFSPPGRCVALSGVRLYALPQVVFEGAGLLFLKVGVTVRNDQLVAYVRQWINAATVW